MFEIKKPGIYVGKDKDGDFWVAENPKSWDQVGFYGGLATDIYCTLGPFASKFRIGDVRRIVRLEFGPVLYPKRRRPR